ncbi:MAG: DUF5655 domain-containing protein [Bacteroidota bacterium]|nr:DUF5655 domain-containing protein [Bacteroidota bacterium]
MKLWTCPKCGRKFERQGQTHSCRPFLLEQHFEGKPAGKLLYEKLRKAVRKQAGPFKTESLECCIHFVSTCTFAAVKIFRNKIRVDFSLSRKIKSKRFSQAIKMSAHRYFYYIDIYNEDEIDEELVQWIQEAHDKKKEELIEG